MMDIDCIRIGVRRGSSTPSYRLITGGRFATRLRICRWANNPLLLL